MIEFFLREILLAEQDADNMEHHQNSNQLLTKSNF